MWEVCEVHLTKNNKPIETIYQNESIWLVALKLIELVLQNTEKAHIYTINNT